MTKHIIVKKRNKRIIEFAVQHPEYTQEKIARIFHVNQQAVSRALNSARPKLCEVGGI